MKRLDGETDGDYIERLENQYDIAAQYIQQLDHLLNEYKSGLAKLDLPSSGKWRGPKIFTRGDAEKVEWDEKTAAMRQPADAAAAYDLRLRLELAELRANAMAALVAVLRSSLARWESDPELVKTITTADYMHDRKLQETEERRQGGLKTGHRSSVMADKNRKLAETIYAAVRDVIPGAKPAVAYPKYFREAEAACLKPWSKKYFISQVKSATA